MIIRILEQKDQTSEFVIENGVLIDYLGKSRNVVVPNSVKRIGNCAFIRCTSLTDITIPDSVTSIGKGALSSRPKRIVHTNNQYVIDYCEENNIPCEYDK